MSLSLVHYSEKSILCIRAISMVMAKKAYILGTVIALQLCLSSKVSWLSIPFS